jgi:hypothetical protein
MLFSCVVIKLSKNAGKVSKFWKLLLINKLAHCVITISSDNHLVCVSTFLKFFLFIYIYEAFKCEQESNCLLAWSVWACALLVCTSHGNNRGRWLPTHPNHVHVAGLCLSVTSQLIWLSLPTEAELKNLHDHCPLQASVNLTTCTLCF